MMSLLLSMDLKKSPVNLAKANDKIIFICPAKAGGNP